MSVLSCQHDLSWHHTDAYRQVFIFLSILRLKLHTLVARECLASGVSLLVGLDIFDYSAWMVLFSNVYTRIHKWMKKLFRGLGQLYP